ncbi:GIY-YIG nuclease family protein [Burkholderia diffusa]|uniref:GIY-YIG nuclease family protein n=1 Tax=Burkholderia diffusa TaxID=488732 RepID=UPI000A9E5AC1|nr:GIY-YIG nuclease family protein [Burkholderia diffusa]
MSVLYLLVNEEATAFKIGVSQRPHSRIASLPVSIDTSLSLEVEMLDGNAYGAERTLHYLFRNRRYPMPHGDGYTEWFEITALPEVVGFLAEQRDKLGTGQVRPLRPPAPPPKVSPVEAAAKLEAKRQRVEERARRWAEEYARAKAHNSDVLAWCRHIFAEMVDAKALVGIVRPRPENPHGDGYLYLQGEDCDQWLRALTNPLDEHTSLAPVGIGAWKLFGGAFQSSHPLIEVNVSRDLLIEPSPLADEQRYPGANAIRIFLCERAASIGSPEDAELWEVHKVIAKLRAEFWHALRGE